MIGLIDLAYKIIKRTAHNLEGLSSMFDKQVSNTIDLGDKVVVITDGRANNELNYDSYHNVYCVSKSGNLLWQIGARPKGDEAVYVDISLKTEGLLATDFMGRRYWVDVNSGEIVGKQSIVK